MENLLETKDYEIFKVCSWNRSIKSSNLKKIDESVQKEGWLKHPIMVNEKMEVIDGQHRLLYAREHGLPVYYVVVNGLSINDCVAMNTARTSWNIADYIKFYSDQGNESYKILRNLLERYPFCAPTILANVIKNAGASGGMAHDIKAGVFRISPEEYELAVKKLQFLDGCAKELLSLPGRSSALLTAVSFAYDCPGVDQKRLFRQIKTYSNIMIPPANFDMALRQIEELYNYRGSKENYVYIYTEYKKHAYDRKVNGFKGEKYDKSK